MKNKIKSLIGSLLTGKPLAKLIGLVSTAAIAYFMKGWAAVVAYHPDVAAAIDPRELVEAIDALISGGLVLVAAWLFGKGPRELQAKLREHGVDVGPIDGVLDDKSFAGLDRAINDPSIRIPVERARLVEEPDDPEPPSAPRQRPRQTHNVFTKIFGKR